MKGLVWWLVFFFSGSLLAVDQAKGAAADATATIKRGLIHNLLRGEVPSHVVKDVATSTRARVTEHQDEIASAIGSTDRLQKKHLLQQEGDEEEEYYNPTEWWKDAVELSSEEDVNATSTSTVDSSMVVLSGQESHVNTTTTASVNTTSHGGDVACKLDKSILVMTHVLRGAFGLEHSPAFTIANRLYMALDMNGQRKLDQMLYEIPTEPGLQHFTVKMLEMFRHAINDLGMVFTIEQVAMVHEAFAPVVVEIMKFMYQVDGYPDKGMYSLAGYMNSTASLMDTLQQSIRSCFQHVTHCHDNVDYYYFDETSFCLRTCALIGRLDTTRRLAMCQKQEVMDNCPYVCGTCCEDDPSYEIIVQNHTASYVRGCSWLMEDPNMVVTRRAMYCDDITEEDGRMIRHYCPLSCNSCYTHDSPTESPTTASPTSPPTVSPTPLVNTPTISPIYDPTSLPSGSPTLTPTVSPTSHPTQNPSITQMPSSYPVDNPSTAPTGSVEKWVKMGWDIYGNSDNERFGWKLSLSGDGKTLAIRTFNNIVRVYRWNETSLVSQYGQWVQFGNELIGEQFELDYDGTTIALGTPTDGNGRVQFFLFNSTYNQWDHIGKDIVGTSANDKFGTSLSLSSDSKVLAVGATSYIATFTLNATNPDPTQQNWVQKGNYLIGGSDVSINEDGSVVATLATNKKVRVYTWNDEADPRPEYHYWEEKTLNFMESTSVSMSGKGDVLALSDYVKEYRYNRLGYVSIMGSSYSWVQSIRSLAIRGVQGRSNFGLSIQLSRDGRILVIGVPNYDNPGEADIGMVQVWKWNESENQWSQLPDIFGESAGDQAGYSVSLSLDGDVLAIGSIYGDGRYTNGGRIRVYRLSN